MPEKNVLDEGKTVARNLFPRGVSPVFFIPFSPPRSGPSNPVKGFGVG